MKHSPQIALTAAISRLDAAYADCPHWDYDSDGSHSECCYRVDDAFRAVKAARTAVDQTKLVDL